MLWKRLASAAGSLVSALIVCVLIGAVLIEAFGYMIGGVLFPLVGGLYLRAVDPLEDILPITSAPPTRRQRAILTTVSAVGYALVAIAAAVGTSVWPVVLLLAMGFGLERQGMMTSAFGRWDIWTLAVVPESFVAVLFLSHDWHAAGFASVGLLLVWASRVGPMVLSIRRAHLDSQSRRRVGHIVEVGVSSPDARTVSI